MKSIKEILFEVVGIFLFCTALSLFFLQQKQISRSYQEIKNYVMDNDVLYEKSDSTTSDFFTLTKEEVIADLMTGISYDIKINGIYYLAYDFNPFLFDFSSLKETYNKSYVFDSKTGDIEYVSYK